MGAQFDDAAAAALVTKQREFFSRGMTQSIEYRMEQIRRLKDALRMREVEALAALSQDLRKSDFESYGGEVGFMYEEIKYTLKNLRKWAKPKRAGTPLVLFRSRSFVQPVPKGCALIIGPWNYPLQLALAPLLGAISAGCPAIIKASEYAPATSAFLKSLIEDTFPEEFVALVEGAVPETTSLLKQRFDHIFFTGSTAVGRIVMAEAAKHLTPVTLELGGKSPCIVDKTADIAVTAKRIVWGKLYNGGQTCVAPDYLLVDKSVKDALITAMRKAVEDMYGEDPQKSPEYPRMISDKHFDRLVGMLDGKGSILMGGKHDRADRYIAPTVLEDVPNDHPLMQEEIFGPILPIVPIDNLDDAKRRIAERPNPLACYIFTNDPLIEKRVVQEISFGGGCINNALVHFANPNIPVGGIGQSGIGAYHGKGSFDTFTHYKSMMKTYFWPDAPLKYPPYGNRIDLIKKLIN